jgi:F0F1-type ATP synthase membrane subunit a
MLIIVAVISLFLIGATGPRAVVPGRLQSAAELSYEFVAGALRSSTGPEGMKFFPFVSGYHNERISAQAVKTHEIAFRTLEK